VEEWRGQRRIEAASGEAAQRGVRQGQSLAQARALCPDLLLDDADPEADRGALADMARWCERISPLTAPDPPDGLWIDIAGCAHLLGGEEKLAMRLRQRLAPCRLAIADTAGAAWALARAATRGEVEIIAPSQHGQAIADLPVGMLRLDAQVCAGLQRVGLHSVEALRRLPRPDLTARFGASPGRQLDRALGSAAEPIIWQCATSQWREHRPFVEPIGTDEDLTRALHLLAEPLCSRLEAAGLGGARFRVRFIRVDNAAQELCLTTARPLHNPARLARLLADQLERVEPGFGVEAMSLEAEETAPLARHQPTLGAQPVAEDLVELLDTTTNRLGAARVWRPMPVASHVPERAVGAAPPLREAEFWCAPPGPRPIRLISPPEVIEVTAPVPDDPPILFRWRGALHRVRAASGPERIAAEWWRRSDMDERFRDYYRVEDQAGARFWLFRTSLPGETRPVNWYLHGLFG
jgi:protein ImuB